MLNVAQLKDAVLKQAGFDPHAEDSAPHFALRSKAHRQFWCGISCICMLKGMQERGSETDCTTPLTSGEFEELLLRAQLLN